MSVLIRKQKGVPNITGIGKLSIIVFLMALSSSIIETIWAVYIDSFVHSEVIVGFISAGLTIVSLISFIVFIPVIERTNKTKLFVISLVLYALTYILFAINQKFYVFILLAFALSLIYTFRVTSFGIIIKDKSSKSQLSRNEGLMYTFMNSAWVIGPLIAGYIAKNYGINLIFLLSSIFIILSLIIFKFSNIKDANIKKKTDNNIIKNIKDFFKSKERTLVYFLSGGGNLWWVLVYLFMPLHIIRSGLDNLWIGYFMFAVAIPLILSEYKFSKIAGKYGFKKMFKIGFAIPLIIAISCFFVSNIYLLMGLIVLASFGIAMTEPTTDAYFFDIIKKKDESRFFGPFNTSIDVSQSIGKIFSSIILIFLPFKYVFLLFAFFMFVLFLLSFRIKEVIEKNKK